MLFTNDTDSVSVFCCLQEQIQTQSSSLTHWDLGNDAMSALWNVFYFNASGSDNSLLAKPVSFISNVFEIKPEQFNFIFTIT